MSISFLSKCAGFALCAALLPGGVVFAQSDALRKAVGDVKTSVDTLVVARDENVTDDFALRLDAFKKVVALSISEVRDFKVSLLVADGLDADAKMWREAMIAALNEATAYFEREKDAVSEIKNLDEVKARAIAFKEWREAHYMPAAAEIMSFLLLGKGREAAKIASLRTEKIGKDVVKITKLAPRAGGALKTALQKASRAVDTAEGALDEAERVFRAAYVAPRLAASASSSPAFSSSPESSTLALPPALLAAGDAAPASSSLRNAAGQDQSIRNLVRSSYGSIRDAYQIFIEMSNSVRESL